MSGWRCAPAITTQFPRCLSGSISSPTSLRTGGPCPSFLACTTTTHFVGSCLLYPPPLAGQCGPAHSYLSWLSQARPTHPLRCGPGVPRSLPVLPLFEGLSLPLPLQHIQHSLLRMVNSYLYPCSSLESFRDNLIGLSSNLIFFICLCLFYQGEVIQGTGHKDQGLLHLGAVYLCINTS